MFLLRTSNLDNFIYTSLFPSDFYIYIAEGFCQRAWLIQDTVPL